MIFIEGNVPSLKNSKVKTSRGIFSSPTVSKYCRKNGIQHYNVRRKEVKGYVDPDRYNKIEALRDDFKDMMEGKEYPIFIGYHHIRNSKRLFDFSNSVEILQDLFQAHDFIEDDNVKYMFPIPMTIDGELPTRENIRDCEWYSVDKHNPGVYIKIF
jgi:hypothetical protein